VLDVSLHLSELLTEQVHLTVFC